MLAGVDALVRQPEIRRAQPGHARQGPASRPLRPSFRTSWGLLEAKEHEDTLRRAQLGMRACATPENTQPERNRATIRKQVRVFFDFGRIEKAQKLID